MLRAGWFEIPVNDMDRAVKFYEQIFGFNTKGHNPGALEMARFPFLAGAMCSPRLFGEEPMPQSLDGWSANLFHCSLQRRGVEVGGDQGGKRSVGGKSDSAAFEKDGLAAQCTEWILDELEEGDRPIFQEFQSLFSWNSPLDIAN